MGRSANPSNTEKDKDKDKDKNKAKAKSASNNSGGSDVVERSGGLGGGKGAERNAAKYEKSTAKERAKSNSDGRYGYFDDKLKTYVPARIDMQNGGGADVFGDEFKGHPIYSTLLNAFGVKPYGSERERPYGGAYQAPAIAQAINNSNQGSGAASQNVAPPVVTAPMVGGYTANDMNLGSGIRPAGSYSPNDMNLGSGVRPIGAYNPADMNLGSGMRPAGSYSQNDMDLGSGVQPAGMYGSADMNLGSGVQQSAQMPPLQQATAQNQPQNPAQSQAFMDFVKGLPPELAASADQASLLRAFEARQKQRALSQNYTAQFGG